MKNLRILSLIVMMALSIYFVIQWQIQTRKAEEALERAVQYEHLATENLERAVRQEEIAMMRAAEAVQAQNRAEELRQALEKCQKN